MNIEAPGGMVQLSDEAYRTYTRVLASDRVTNDWCAAEELIDGGHAVLHELVETGLIGLIVFRPGPTNPAGRVN